MAQMEIVNLAIKIGTLLERWKHETNFAIPKEKG
jgi:hypothetical protein